MVAPTRARGLKQVLSHTERAPHRVAPTRARGLKRQIAARRIAHLGRAHAGARIETGTDGKTKPYCNVAPTRARGLKHPWPLHDPVKLVAPTRARGLKRLHTSKPASSVGVAPTRARGLKLY